MSSSFNGVIFKHGTLSFVVLGASPDRVSVPLHIAADICDGTQWRGTELTCTCFLCKS